MKRSNTGIDDVTTTRRQSTGHLLTKEKSNLHLETGKSDREPGRHTQSRIDTAEILKPTSVFQKKRQQDISKIYLERQDTGIGFKSNTESDTKCAGFRKESTKVPFYKEKSEILRRQSTQLQKSEIQFQREKTDFANTHRSILRRQSTQIQKREIQFQREKTDLANTNRSILRRQSTQIQMAASKYNTILLSV